MENSSYIIVVPYTSDLPVTLWFLYFTLKWSIYMYEPKDGILSYSIITSVSNRFWIQVVPVMALLIETLTQNKFSISILSDKLYQSAAVHEYTCTYKISMVILFM